jgi:hypothetical protein
LLSYHTGQRKKVIGWRPNRKTLCLQKKGGKMKSKKIKIKIGQEQIEGLKKLHARNVAEGYPLKDFEEQLSYQVNVLLDAIIFEEIHKDNIPMLIARYQVIGRKIFEVTEKTEPLKEQNKLLPGLIELIKF